MAVAGSRVDQVLAQPDDAAANYLFPDLSHGYYYAIDARLRAFGDSARWASPSESETYGLLALMLETLDPTDYRPTLPPNTHWSKWPDSGAL